LRYLLVACFLLSIVFSFPIFAEPKPTPVPGEAESSSAKTPVVAESVDLKEVVESSELEPAVDQPPEPTVEPPVSSEDQGVSEQDLTETQGQPQEDTSSEPAITKIPHPAETQGVENKDLVLLNSVVAPGTAARLPWKPSTAAFSGISSPTPVLVVNGAKAGPSLCITAAVHGDELNGIEIVRHTLYNIDPKNLAGAVIGIPIVNLEGFRRSSRYLSDRRDLNRYFPGRALGSVASRMAHSLFAEVMVHCDYLVDLHTGSFRRTNLPQLRADLSQPKVADLAKRLGGIVVLQSKGHPGSLRRAAVEAGIPAVTMELGEPLQLQKKLIDHGIDSIENLIDSLGMEKRLGFFSIKPEPVYYRSKWVRATDGGILFSEVELGDRVSKGAVLGVVTDPITNMRHKIKAPFSGRVIGMALNQVLYPGFAAYHIGLQSSAEKAAKDTESSQMENGEEGPAHAPVDEFESDPDPRAMEDSE
jgi:predicted deacylase